MANIAIPGIAVAYHVLPCYRVCRSQARACLSTGWALNHCVAWIFWTEAVLMQGGGGHRSAAGPCTPLLQVWTPYTRSTAPSLTTTDAPCSPCGSSTRLCYTTPFLTLRAWRLCCGDPPRMCRTCGHGLGQGLRVLKGLGGAQPAIVVRWWGGGEGEYCDVMFGGPCCTCPLAACRMAPR